MLAGENGIITQAAKAKLNTEIGELDEKIKLYEIEDDTNENSSDNSIYCRTYSESRNKSARRIRSYGQTAIC